MKIIFDMSKIAYQDELPDMPDNIYNAWYELSYVDFVRVGPSVQLIWEKQNDN